MPPNPDSVVSKGIQVHWLGFYVKWHPQGAYYYSVENGDFKAAPERTVGTYSTYNSIDDKIDDLHYYTTYIKFGIGRATYDASQEVRNNHLTREEAIKLVSRYDGEYPDKYIDEVLDYIDYVHKNCSCRFGGCRYGRTTLSKTQKKLGIITGESLCGKTYLEHFVNEKREELDTKSWQEVNDSATMVWSEAA